MTQWPDKPFIYQINTAVWLTDLSQRFNQPVTLDTVPEAVFDELAALNVDAIWLMGVWQRSPAVRDSALNYMHEYRPVLPDLTEADVAGSAYAIGSYSVDERLGGPQGLAAFRRRLKRRNLLLVLDYVPNHVAVDHPWVTQHPEYMVQGTPQELAAYPDRFFRVREKKRKDGTPLIIGHGRDPYFPGWIDTAQVNVFSTAYRKVALEILLDIARQCDAVRCDMAMLVTNEVFQRTWGEHISEPMPKTEYWHDIIPAVRKRYRGFKFIAEVYWDMEYNMIQQGFDYTYDKTLYDRLVESNTHELREHLKADLDYQQHQIRFIENHDEPRAASSLGVERSRPAAVIAATVPGALLLHDGQFSGRRIKLPVQIRRQPHEPRHYGLEQFYRRLLAEMRHPIYQKGAWRLFFTHWPHGEVETHWNLLVYGWQYKEAYRLIVANMTYVWSQGMVDIGAWQGLKGQKWRLHDVLSDSYRHVDGTEVVQHGLPVELNGYEAQILSFEPDPPARKRRLFGRG